MGAYEGGAHLLLLPRMPYWGGGAARVPRRFYATLANIGPKQSPNLLSNSSTTNWHQPSVASQLFSPTPFGGGGVGGYYTYIYLHLGY
jgi:hypothetical protein